MHKFITLIIAAIAVCGQARSVMFTPGPVTISGKVEHYEPGKSPRTALLYIEDPITNISAPKAIDINDDGTFSRTFALTAPQIVAFGDYVSDIYIEPNSDLTITIHTGSETFGGTLGEVNTQLRNAPKAPYVYAHYNKGQYPKEQKDWVCFTLAPWEAKLKEYMSTLPSESLAHRILSSKAAALRAEGILDIAFSENYDNTQVGPDFYADALQGLFSADTLAYLHGGPLLNRLAYNRMIPYEQIAVYPRKILAGWDFLREHGVKLEPTPMERALRATTDSVYYMSSSAIFSAAAAMYQAAQGQAIPEEYTAFNSAQGATARMLENDESLALRVAAIKQLTQSDTIPFIWQMAMAQRAVNVTNPEYLQQIFAQEITDPDLQAAITRAIQRTEGVSVWELPNTEGGRIMRKIMEPYRGKHVLVDFWGLGCGPCRQGIQNSQEFRRTHRANPDFTFLFLSAESEGSQEAYNKYAAEHLEGNDHLRLSDDDMAHLRELFEFNAIPHYRIFNP